MSGRYTHLAGITALVLLATSGSAHGSIQHPFMANQGQAHQSLAFHAPALEGAIGVTRQGEIVYAMPDPGGRGGVVLREVFAGARGCEPRGEEPLAARVSSFRGRDRAGWQQAIPAYGRVDLGEVYPGIRIELRMRGESVEKLFILDPGVSPEQIRLRVVGAERLSIGEEGALQVDAGGGRMSFTPPVAYQDTGGIRTFIAASYDITGTSYGFAVGAYDHRRPLVIDPLLASTYLGGGRDDGLCGPIDVDDEGNIYVAGHTVSLDFPVTPTGYDTLGDWDGDVFISKFDPDLSTLIASTYLGGTDDDGGIPGVRLAFDSQGCVIVSSWTSSDDFPIPGPAYDDDYWAGNDVFIAKLSGDLDDLLAATYIGGGNSEILEGLTVDQEDNILVTGSTLSLSYPTTPGACDTTYNGGTYIYGDVFVSQLTPDLDSLIASTFLGGDTYDDGTALVPASDGSIYVTGYTWSDDFPTVPGCYQDEHQGGGYDVFIARLGPGLATLPAATLLGAEGSDLGLGIELRDDGSVYVAGHTGSRTFPMAGLPYCRNYSGQGGSDVGDDVFVARLSSDLTTLLNATYLGGTLWETANDLHLDGRGNVYLTGSSSSDDFPTSQGAYDRTYNGGTNQYYGDAWLARMDLSLHTLQASTYIGSPGEERAVGIVRDQAGQVYAVGSTTSPNFPTTEGAFCQVLGGGHQVSGGDVFVCKFDSLLTAVNAQDVPSATDNPGGIRLRGYPEPLRGVGKVGFTLPCAARIELGVYDETGRIVRRLATGPVPAGERELAWDGRGDDGKPLPSGAYFYRLRVGREMRSVRVTLLR